MKHRRRDLSICKNRDYTLCQMDNHHRLNTQRGSSRLIYLRDFLNVLMDSDIQQYDHLLDIMHYFRMILPSIDQYIYLRNKPNYQSNHYFCSIHLVFGILVRRKDHQQ